MSAAGCHPAGAGCGRAGGAGHVPPEGTGALRDILHGGDDVLGSRNSKEPLNRPQALCSLFSALLSLPPPAFCCFSGWLLHESPHPSHPPWGQPLSEDGVDSCKRRAVEWKGSRAEFSLPGEDERFPSLWRPRTSPWCSFMGNRCRCCW